MKPTVLIVEDELPVVTLLRYNLMHQNFAVDVARDGEEAIVKIKERPPDVVILDWMLPHLSGLDVCRQIRGRPDTRNLPIIMLTARGEETDKMRGLDQGADDYVTKPFSVGELLARVRAVLRRARPALGEGRLTFKEIVIDLTAHRVTRNGRNVHLGPTEFRLLCLLMENPRRVFSRAQLLDAVWGHDAVVEQRTVDVHVLRLRKALNEDGEKDPIRTVRSFGYGMAIADA